MPTIDAIIATNIFATHWLSLAVGYWRSRLLDLNLRAAAELSLTLLRNTPLVIGLHWRANMQPSLVSTPLTGGKIAVSGNVSGCPSFGKKSNNWRAMPSFGPSVVLYDHWRFYLLTGQKFSPSLLWTKFAKGHIFCPSVVSLRPKQTRYGQAHTERYKP